MRRCIESILFPSAGISHNFATYTLVLQNGNVVSGILVSRTADSIAVKGIDAITRTYRMSEVEDVKEQAGLADSRRTCRRR